MGEKSTPYVCTVCRRDVQPDPTGKILVVGITTSIDSADWVWGPEPCHRICQSLVRSPYDDRLRAGRYMRTWQWMPA